MAKSFLRKSEAAPVGCPGPDSDRTIGINFLLGPECEEQVNGFASMSVLISGEIFALGRQLSVLPSIVYKFVSVTLCVLS